MRTTQLRIAGVHAAALRSHLFPGDGKEAVAFALCGRHRAVAQDVLVVRDVVPVAYADCPVREEGLVTWRTQAIEPLLIRAGKEKLGVVKFHSHPTGFPRFSATDDVSDADLFPSVYGWVDDDGPHASVVMLPNGQFFGRSIDVENRFSALERICVVGHDVSIFWIPPLDPHRLTLSGMNSFLAPRPRTCFER
ncbi:MAG: Mov34/MPN/PAD-1 family protein [Myxococcota bacterium]